MQVTLLSHHHARNRLCPRVIQNLVIDRLNHLKAAPQSDAVYQDIPMNTNSMSRIQDGVFILTCCVDDVAVVFLVAILDRLVEDILNGRVV